MIGILGYTGYIGSELCKHVPAVHIDRDLKGIEQCDKLYYLAGVSQPGGPIEDYFPNISLTQEVIKRFKGEVVFTSTIKVYDDMKQVNPEGNYEKSKYICEMLLNSSKLKVQILRLANVVGPGLKYGHLFNLIEQAKKGHITTYSGSYRPYIYLDDCIRGILLDKPPGIYNLSCPAISIEKTLAILQKYWKFTITYKYGAIQLEPSWGKMKDLGWLPTSSAQNVENICKLSV